MAVVKYCVVNYNYMQMNILICHQDSKLHQENLCEPWCLGGENIDLLNY